MLEFYQDLPLYISPIAFSIGWFSVHWYSLMWIIAFVVVYLFLAYRLKKGEGKYDIEFIQNVVSNSLIGALIGGRIGYVLFYDLNYYVAHPLQIISPYDPVLHEWVGIYGMSYHGGLIGVAIAFIITARKNNQDLFRLTDFIVPVIPIGYMFGRIGNFMNGELFGRVTNSFWGMHFDSDVFLRHPSQLYEGFFEGIVLFAFLWSLRNAHLKKGVLTALYVIGYACARFGVEYFREPDAHLGFIFGQWTMGQVLSFCMLIGGFGMILWLYRKELLKFLHRGEKV